MIMGAVTAAISCSAFLIGYLSLVRRIKARNLWKNSILRWICSFIYRIFSNLHCLWRRIIMFGGFVLIHWITILCWPSGFWGIFMLAAEEMCIRDSYKALADHREYIPLEER